MMFVIKGKCKFVISLSFTIIISTLPGRRQNFGSENNIHKKFTQQRVLKFFLKN